MDFIGVEDIQELLNAIGIAAFIERLSKVIEEDYLRWSDFEKSARLASHSADGVIELMPTSDGQQYAFKYVNGHPKNTAAGLLTVTAFGVLADVGTGYPLLLSEMTITTALRTAAMSALVARWVARPESRSMAIIGNGSQSEFQAIAFHRMLGIREFRLFDVDGRATEKLKRNLMSCPDVEGAIITRAASCAEAVRGADIITTVTADKRNAVILTPPMVATGVHVNAVGGDCPGKTELHRDIFANSNVRVIVEYEPQSRIEGEIQQLPDDYPVVEFHQIVGGAAVGRRAPSEITIFDSVGFALEDYSALRLLHSLRDEFPQCRRTIDLVPELADPKDLYGGTMGARKAVGRVRRVA